MQPSNGLYFNELMLNAFFPALNVGAWLQIQATSEPTSGYTHRLIVENSKSRNEAQAELSLLADQAHEDARRHLRGIAAVTLDPLSEPLADPAEGYPQALHPETLKSYLGELLVGVIAERFSPFGIKWIVPAYPLSLHDLAFDQLETWRQTDQPTTMIPGQGGNDCLAFESDPTGRIRRTLVCESKCTKNHDTRLIAAAHSDISRTIVKSIRKIIEILATRGDEDSRKWLEALRILWLGGPAAPGQYERCNLVLYVCGTSPKKTPTWIPTDKPHENYTSNARLEAVEIHLEDVSAVVDAVYGIN